MPYSNDQINEYLDHVEKTAAASKQYTPDQIAEYSQHVKDTYGKPDAMEQQMALDPINPDQSFLSKGQKAAAALGPALTAGAVVNTPALLDMVKAAGPTVARGMGLGGAYEVGSAIMRRIGKYLPGGN